MSGWINWTSVVLNYLEFECYQQNNNPRVWNRPEWFPFNFMLLLCGDVRRFLVILKEHPLSRDKLANDPEPNIVPFSQ